MRCRTNTKWHYDAVQNQHKTEVPKIVSEIDCARNTVNSFYKLQAKRFTVGNAGLYLYNLRFVRFFVYSFGCLSFVPSFIFYSMKFCAICYSVRQLEQNNTVLRHIQTARLKIKQIGFSAVCAASSDYSKSMKPQVHIRHFSGTVFTTNVCITEEILCKCGYNLLQGCC